MANFTLHEFASKDGAPMPPDVEQNIRHLIANLEKIRTAAGNVPIKITSGYRSPARNAKIKGANKSYHVLGMAADFKIQGMAPKQVYSLCQQLINQGIILPGGLGLYPKWVHYDIRGYNVRWQKI